MDSALSADISARLISDFGFKPRGNFIREGRCPSCNQKELYAPTQAPWWVRCGRLNKCGAELSTKELYPDLFDDWSKRYQPTEAEPMATATAYLFSGRGLDPAITNGEYTQELFKSTASGEVSATVRFPLRKGGWWERLIDRPQRFGKMKARFKPADNYLGRWWQPARFNAQEVTEIWITEGIFDALALWHYGKSAVAALSSNHFPLNDLEDLVAARAGKLPVLIWALDGDKAGASFTRKHMKRAREMGFMCTCSVVAERDATGKRLDWNDMHQRGRLDDAAFDEAAYQGSLLTATSAVEKGVRMYHRNKNPEFWFPFENRIFWFKFDNKRYEEALNNLGDDEQTDLDEEGKAALAQKHGGVVQEICNCYPEVLYHQRQEVTDESWYYVRINFPHGAAPAKMAFTPGQIGTSAEFKKKLLNAAGAWWTGSQYHMDRVMKYQTYNIKSVETIDYIGYSREHNAYLLGDLAVKDGRVISVNDEDFFEFNKVRVKSTMKGVALSLQRDPNNYRQDWLRMLYMCFGTQGIVALAFWTGSVFCEQIRRSQKSFPFLEVTGEAGAGKTTLLLFLWKLFGREYEGFDPSKSSIAGRSRAMGQVAGMPVVLIEGDRNTPDKAHPKSFDWDELKDFFGGGTLRTRGVRNGGNDTYEPPFRGTICISQNADVVAHEAIMTRIVKLKFKRPVVTTESRAAADNLNMMPVENLSHYLIMATKKEKELLALFERQCAIHEKTLRAIPDIRIERIIKNHSQIMALVDCLALLTPISQEQINTTQREIIGMAMDRQLSVNADHPLVHQFWEVYDYIESRGNDASVLNHSSDSELIAINLNEFAEQAALYKQQIGDIHVLREVLKTSRRNPFVASNHTVHSVIRSRGGVGRSASVRCWVFKKPKQS